MAPWSGFDLDVGEDRLTSDMTSLHVDLKKIVCQESM